MLLAYDRFYRRSERFDDVRDAYRISPRILRAGTAPLVRMRCPILYRLPSPSFWGPVRHAPPLCNRGRRYVLFSARTDGRMVTVTHLFVTTGAGFQARFPG